MLGPDPSCSYPSPGGWVGILGRSPPAWPVAVCLCKVGGFPECLPPCTCCVALRGGHEEQMEKPHLGGFYGCGRPRTRE